MPAWLAALLALLGLTVTSLSLLVASTSGRERRIGRDAHDVVVVRSPPTAPQLLSAALEPEWRARLRAARAKRCARAVAGSPIACAHAASGGPVQTLTRELVSSVADERRLVFVAFANGAYADFATTWIANLARANVTCMLLGAMDAAALDVFARLDVAHFMMSTPRALLARAKTASGPAPSAYLQLGSYKTALLAEILEYGVDVVLSDVDNVILRDPRPLFARYPEADVLATADLLSPTSTSGGLEIAGAGVHSASLNVGMMLLRASARALVGEWAEHMAQHPTHWDQSIFDQMAKRGSRGAPTKRGGQLWPCYGGALLCGVLPIATFCGGHQYHAERLPHKLGRRPYALHTTYINSMDQGKRHRLREAMAFEDPPSYYDVRVLSYTPDVPARLYSPRRYSLAAPSRLPQFTVDEHFALVHHQLAQLRNALALANATGRLLVLPRLVCGLDRFFYRHDGTSPGSAMHPPLWNCPADMVLALQRGIKPTPERYLREASFLENPRLPPSFAEAGATVEVALEAREGARGGAQGRRAEVLAALGSPAASAARVVTIVGTPPDLQEWMAPAEYASFEAQVREWADFWCCARIEDHLPPAMLNRVIGPGHNWELPLKAKTHVFFDFFWDKVPHTDKVGRTWTGAWRPIPGEKWNLTDAMSEPWRSMVVFGTPPKKV